MRKPTIESLANKLSELVPERLKDLGSRVPGSPPDLSKLEGFGGQGFDALKADLETNFSAVLQSTFEKMELVSREEFDVQRKVLARTRDKLEQLEAELRRIQAEAASHDDAV